MDNGSWVSPEGLFYRGFGDPGFDTRVDHILDHTRPRFDRANTDLHGYFVDEFVDGNPLAVVDEAWIRRSDADDVFEQLNDAGDVTRIEYTVDMGRDVGRISGSLGADLNLPPTQFVTVVVEASDETRIVTAFPALVDGDGLIVRNG